MPVPVPVPMQVSMLDRLRAWRDGTVARPGFRAWAARFPLTRPVARRRSRALFDLCAGFVYSQVLQACVQLRVFELLAERPRTRDELATLFAMAPEKAGSLLDAAAALDLVALRRGRYALGSLGAAMVGNAGVAAMVRHHAMLYADLADPVALLRGGAETRLAAYWPYAAESPPDALEADQVAPYSALMAASQPMVAAEVLDAVDMRRYRRLLDVGGGDGGFAQAALERAPGLRATVFDLPAVAALAQARFTRAGLADRGGTAGGDMFRDDLPGGHDLISLVRVAHDHDDGRVTTLFRAARRALAPGGTLLVAEPMAGASDAEQACSAYFAMYLLAMGRGQPRSPARLCAMLTEAGFRGAGAMATGNPLITGVVVASA